MRFFIAVIDSTTGSATGDEMQAIDAFNEKLEANGHWIFACGVSSPEKATLIDNRSDAGIVTAGPLYNNEQYVSGFWLINAEDESEALALATEGSKACNRKVEVRALL